MRHRVAGRKFGLPSNQRKALLKGLLRAVMSHENILTTEPRAKDVRILVERTITKAKAGDINARRIIRKDIPDEKLVNRIVNDLAPRYKDRPGGYTRITKIGPRRGDCAMMVKLELIND